MISYVVKKWEVNDQLNSDGNYVEIKGRAGGLISWILSKLGISPTVTMKFCESALSFETGSWSGKMKKIIPYKRIVSVQFGYYKPWKESVIAFVITYLLLGFLFNHYFSLIVGIILGVLYYVLNKALSIGVFDKSGSKSVIYFRRSVIEGHSLQEKDAERVCEILYAKIEETL